MSKRYKIVQVSDFLDIPEDKLDECLVDFKTFLLYTGTLGAVGRVVEPNMKISVMLKGSHFTWIDDGKHDLKKVIIQSKDSK